jgi:hypothetical protein
VRARFDAWRRRRPFAGGVLLALSGIEMFFSGQLDLGHIRIQMGFEGFQATVIPALLTLLGVLVIATPAQRMFSGIFALILAVYSLIGVNLGGFVVGMLLGSVGGILVVAWAPKAVTTAAAAGVGDREPQRAAPVIGAARHAGVVHAEAVDFATLRARAEGQRRSAATATAPAAEPRPFARSRS